MRCWRSAKPEFYLQHPDACGFMTEPPFSRAGRPMIKVAPLADLADGKLKLVRADHARIALVRIGDEVRAVSAMCTHARIFLAPGQLTSDGLIECPSHGAKFSPDDGAVHCAPATRPLAVYEVSIANGAVYVDPGLAPSDHPEPTTRPGARPSTAQWGNWG